MADRDLTAEAAELLLVEDLGDETEVAQRGEPAMLRDRDACGFLTSMLQRKEPEIREPGDIAVGRVDAEDAAHG